MYRLLVVEFESVLMPAGQVLAYPADLISAPILEALLQPWHDVRIVVTRLTSGFESARVKSMEMPPLASGPCCPNRPLFHSQHVNR